MFIVPYTPTVNAQSFLTVINSLGHFGVTYKPLLKVVFLRSNLKAPIALGQRGRLESHSRNILMPFNWASSTAHAITWAGHCY